MEKTYIVSEWLKGHSRKFLDDLKYKEIKNKSDYCRFKATEVKKIARRLVDDELLKYYKEEMS